MIIGFSSRAWEDYLYWQKEDKKVLKRINLLIADAGKNPTGGIGNTEALEAQSIRLVFQTHYPGTQDDLQGFQ